MEQPCSSPRPSPVPAVPELAGHCVTAEPPLWPPPAHCLLVLGSGGPPAPALALCLLLPVTVATRAHACLPRAQRGSAHTGTRTPPGVSGALHMAGTFTSPRGSARLCTRRHMHTSPKAQQGSAHMGTCTPPGAQQGSAHGCTRKGNWGQGQPSSRVGSDRRTMPSGSLGARPSPPGPTTSDRTWLLPCPRASVAMLVTHACTHTHTHRGREERGRGRSQPFALSWRRPGGQECLWLGDPGLRSEDQRMRRSWGRWQPLGSSSWCLLGVGLTQNALPSPPFPSRLPPFPAALLCCFSGQGLGTRAGG